jgi:hypothetical protein
MANRAARQQCNWEPSLWDCWRNFPVKNGRAKTPGRKINGTIVRDSAIIVDLTVFAPVNVAVDLLYEFH